MPATDLSFLSFDRNGAVGQSLVFTISPDDLRLSESIIAKRSIFVSETGEEISTTVTLSIGTNSVTAEVPIDMHPGKFAFGVVLTDRNSTQNRWIASTPLDSITIRDGGGRITQSPVINTVSFVGGSTSINESDLQKTPLVVTGLYLKSIKECRLNALPSLVFNRIAQTGESVSFRAVNLPLIEEGTTISRVTFRYEIVNELSQVIDTGFLSAPQSISIVVTD